MLIRQIALVSQTKKVSFSALSRVGAALQKQIARDLSPIWEIKATVDSFAALDQVPVGYWPIIITEKNLGDAAGVHEDKEGQPFALVSYSYGWSLTASHECLEMLVDPFGNRIMAGGSPRKGQGRVEFLVEVCDPSEDTPFAYRANGVLVSDFYTPHYFDPVAAPGVRYSFTGALTAPRQVLQNGYLSWHDPKTDHWFQETFFGGSQPQFRDLGAITTKQGENLRRMIYNATPERLAVRQVKGKDLQAAKVSMESHGEAANSRATMLKRRMGEVIKAAMK
jgi:hypothetical protein